MTRKSYHKEMLKSIFKLVLILFVVISCSRNKVSRYDTFIDKYEGYEFDSLRGYGVFRRGADSLGNKLIYVSKTLDTNIFLNSGNAIIAFDSNSVIKYIDTMSMNFHIDVDEISSVALSFDSLNIQSVSVDYLGNVFFRIYSFDNPDLLYSGSIDLEKNKKSEWVRIAPRWYSKK